MIAMESMALLKLNALPLIYPTHSAPMWIILEDLYFLIAWATPFFGDHYHHSCLSRTPHSLAFSASPLGRVLGFWPLIDSTSCEL